MAWGMYLPNNFGQFFPDGDYVGWHETLEHHYNTEMSDAEKEAMGMQESILHSKFSDKFTKDLGPLKDFECPDHFRADHKLKVLGSLVKLTSRLVCVDEQFKRIIEEFEPDIHQFWPIKISMYGNVTYPGTYFGLRIGRFLNAFCPNESDPNCFEEFNNRYYGLGPTKKYMSGLVFSQQAMSGAHLWREQGISGPDLFLSDALHERSMDMGLRLPRHFRLKEI